MQKRTGEYEKPKMKSDPVMKLPTAYDIILTPAKEERLSQIIIEINNRTGDNQLLPIDQHSGAGDTGQLSHRNSAPGRLAKVISLSYASTKLSIDFV